MPGIHNGIGTTFRSSAFGGGTPPVNLDFVSTWDTTLAGSASDTVVLPLLSGGTYSGTIDWGDGNSDDLSYANRTHVYASSGIYTITISGTIGGWQFNGSGDRLKITDISNWGNFELNTHSVFFGCENVDFSATDAPTISTTSFVRMFRNTFSLSTADINNWNVSGVTTLNECFWSSGITCDLDNWDTSSFQVLRRAFLGASSFNGNVDTWDVSNVTDFFLAFDNATLFNRDISGWDMTSATTVENMLSSTSFNQNINSWNVSTITTFRSIFYNSPFNQPLDTWDVNGANIGYMFFNTPFNQDITGWDVSLCTQFAGIFRDSAFNQNISTWDVGSATTFNEMFWNATAFNQPIGGWDTSNVTNMTRMFVNADAFDQDISGWDINQVSAFILFMQDATGLSTANYDALLIAWDAQGAMAFSGTMNFGGSKYTAGGAAEAARTSLISKWGAIIDGGAA